MNVDDSVTVNTQQMSSTAGCKSALSWCWSLGQVHMMLQFNWLIIFEV